MTQQLNVRTGLKAGMTNPASDYCVQQGGQSLIVKDSQGNEYGLCQLPGNRVEDEWSFYHYCNPG